jgi:2-C-methyl-D-erythritol 2,4-cyclodiphosphate synthase
MRVGIGYDVHPLVAGRSLVLGGVQLEHPAGLDGHSDADVLCHALIDALLGAAALGTIGEHFPADDPQYEGISSLELLAMAANMVEEAGYLVRNVDTVLVAQEPVLQPHLAAMALKLADRLGLDHQMVGVKATSPEGLGALGGGKGIAAQAVVLLEPLAESEI